MFSFCQINFLQWSLFCVTGEKGLAQSGLRPFFWLFLFRIKSLSEVGSLNAFDCLILLFQLIILANEEQLQILSVC